MRIGASQGCNSVNVWRGRDTEQAAKCTLGGDIRPIKFFCELIRVLTQIASTECARQSLLHILIHCFSRLHYRAIHGSPRAKQICHVAVSGVKC